MKPLRMTMEAFGSYASPKIIDFTVPKQNIFLITGETGSGKSMIFDALVFALYGEASSEQYKKSGFELQSQLLDNKQPIVTLEFEHAPGEVYTVIRKGRYVRNDKKGMPKKETGSVELIDPDGVSYPDQKEVDRKIAELVGLDKSQFMQVAMIAQGEFVQLLRTKSDERKETFRKLFGTKIYLDMTDELKSRFTSKNARIREIKSGFMTHASALRYPDDITDKERIDEIAGRIRSAASADKVTDTDLERFASLMEPLCSELEEKFASAAEEMKKLSALRDAKRDAYKNAEALIKSFDSLDKAREQLAACEAEKESIEKSKSLAADITAAYEINSAYMLYAQSAKAAADVRNGLRKCGEDLPKLTAGCEAAASAESSAKQSADRAAVEAARITEQADAALRIFKKLEGAGKEVSFRHGLLKKAETAAADAEKDCADHAEHIKELRAKEKELEKNVTELPKYEKNDSDLASAETVLAETRAAGREAARLEKEAADAGVKYEAAEKKSANAEAEYTARHDAFIHNQAGFLALEFLQDSTMPCPVCGSTEHPKIAVLPEDAADLKKEDIDRLEAELKACQAEKTRLSNEKNAKDAELALRREQFSAGLEKLNTLLSKLFRSVEGGLSLKDAEKKITDMRSLLDAKLTALRGDSQQLEAVRKELSDADEKGRKLDEKSRRLTAAAASAKTDYEKACSTRDALGQGLAYSTAEEASSAKDKVRAVQKETAEAHVLALSALEKARTAKDNCSALINKYTAELPEKEAAENEKLSAYNAVMTEKGLTEEKWQSITSQHERSEAEKLTAAVSEFSSRLSRAQTAAEIAEAQTEGKTRPDAEKLKAEYDEAERSLAAVTGRHGALSSMLSADRIIMEAVVPGTEERKELIRSCRAAEKLYARLKGSKLDIETYVQRWHLEQTLVSANKRFLEMTGNELELHIADEDYLEYADKRSAHGLQIMAYSTFTGKQREVSTLSGGETFMAALSLALGIGDRISSRSAASLPNILFIDEGFGSLSAHARTQAVNILKRLAGGKKLIGLISHVTELQKSIDDKLIVTRTERGSDAVWSE